MLLILYRLEIIQEESNLIRLTAAYMYQMRIRVVSVIDVNNNIIDNIHINGPSHHPISPEFNPANNKLYAES